MSKPIYVLEYDFEVWGKKYGRPHEKIEAPGNTTEFFDMKEALRTYTGMVRLFDPLIENYTIADRNDKIWKDYEYNENVPDYVCAKVKLSLSTDGGVVPMATYERDAFRRD